MRGICGQIRRGVVMSVLVGAAGTAWAEEANKSAYTLFNPTPAALMREMSTDRPDTTESPYTVDAGHFQLEMSLADYTYDRWSSDGVTSQGLAAAPMLLKVGLLNNVDVQLGINPYAWTESKERSTGETTHINGFGDTTLRLKINLWGNDGGETALAVMPFVVLPTAAKGLGTGNVEGGVIVPLSIALPWDFSLGLMLELDLRTSAGGDRYVVDVVTTATVSRPLIGELSGYVEYAGFGSVNHDEGYRAYGDAGLTYAWSANVQLDCGVRLGLTEAAEDVGVFAGISWRY